MAVRHPKPQNQFYRLVLDGGIWRKTTRWGTVFDNVNCMATQGAVAMDAHTNGLIVPTPPRIRSLQYDQSGGIGVDDVGVAWNRGWDKTLLQPPYHDWSDLVASCREGRYVVFAVDYDAVPYEYRAQKSFLGDHAMGASYVYSDGDLLIYDSLGTKPIRMPQSAVKAAAEKIAIRVRGSRSSLFVGLTRVRPSLTAQKWRAEVPAGTFGVYRLDSSGNIAGRTMYRTGGFSADCTVPTVPLKWPGHSLTYRLVRLTSGSRKGLLINATYARRVA